jgi:hypothetical protein
MLTRKLVAATLIAGMAIGMIAFTVGACRLGAALAPMLRATSAGTTVWAALR